MNPNPVPASQMPGRAAPRQFSLLPHGPSSYTLWAGEKNPQTNVLMEAAGICWALVRHLHLEGRLCLQSHFWTACYTRPPLVDSASTSRHWGALRVSCRNEAPKPPHGPAGECV